MKRGPGCGCAALGPFVGSSVEFVPGMILCGAGDCPAFRFCGRSFGFLDGRVGSGGANYPAKHGVPQAFPGKSSDDWLLGAGTPSPLASGTHAQGATAPLRWASGGAALAVPWAPTPMGPPRERCRCGAAPPSQRVAGGRGRQRQAGTARSHHCPKGGHGAGCGAVEHPILAREAVGNGPWRLASAGNP